MTPAELALASEFPAATRERWQDLAGDVPPSPTYDGIARQPLYTAAPPHTRLVRAHGPWDIRQRHTVPDPAAILDDLEHGVTSLWLVGFPPDALPEALREVHLDLAPIVLDAGAEFAASAETLLRLHPEVKGNLGADPIGWLARTGASIGSPTELALTTAENQGLRSIMIDALPYHEAGGSDAQELGCALATAVTYLRELTEAGLDVDTAARQLEFRFAATVDQFLTIAKFRAARRIWARVITVSGGTDLAQRQHAVTSPAVLTRRDPWVNMLRGTVACFAAGVGGADAVTVLPFDSAIGQPDAFGRRIARNTQSILLEESTVASVADPAGESWYVETLTSDLARAAWDFFTAIERAAGGIRAALDSGLIAERLAETWRARKENHDPIVGVTVFPNSEETPLTRPPNPAPPSGGLPKLRYAEEFE